MMRSLGSADRRFVAWSAVIGALAALVAVVAWIVVARSGPDSVGGDRAAIEQAAATAVTEVMTFAPDDDPARRAAVAELLTGSLAADYLGRGADVVFPSAESAGISMAAQVIDVGVAESDGRTARTLVFVDQSVSTGPAAEPDRLAVARWATMRLVDGEWRLARLETVAPQ